MFWEANILTEVCQYALEFREGRGRDDSQLHGYLIMCKESQNLGNSREVIVNVICLDMQFLDGFSSSGITMAIPFGKVLIIG